jgi:hypothetical protein
MKKKELKKYYLQLKILYIYSKKCVELREEYKKFLDQSECDSTHELAINIVKKYNRDIEEYIKKLDELMKENDIKLEKYSNKNIYKILDNTEENSDEESNLEENSNFEEETKKEIKSDFWDYDEDDEYLNYILERKEREKRKVFNAIESILIKFKLKYNDQVLFFLVQEISFELFKISPRWITSQQQYDLAKYIETMSKYDLVSNVVRVRKQLDTNVDCNMDEMDKFININVTMGGEGGIGEIRVIAEQNQTVSEVINRIVHNLKIDDSVEVICRKLLGEKYMFSTQQYSVSKKSKIDSTKKVYEVLNDEQRIYLHLL